MKPDALEETLDIIREYGPIHTAEIQEKSTFSRNRVLHALKVYRDGGYIEATHPNVYEVTLKGARHYRTLRGKNPKGDQLVTDLTVLLNYDAENSKAYEALQDIPNIAHRFLRIGFLYNSLGKDAKNTEVRALNMQHRILMRELEHVREGIYNIKYLLDSMNEDTVSIENLVRYFNEQEHKGNPLPPVHTFSEGD